VKRWGLHLALLLVVALLAALSLLVGTIWLSPQEILAGLRSPQPDLAAIVFLDIHLPRMVLGLLIGGILGLSGAVLQGLLRNPLAEPGLLGISEAASLGSVIAVYYGFAATTTLAGPVLGLLGALAAASVSLLLSRSGSTLSLILAGVATSSIATAGVNLALNLAPNPYAAYEISTWLMGSLADRSWTHVQLAAPFILAGGLLLLLCGRALDALSLGEAQAESLGVNLRRTRVLALAGTALGVGGATAVAGAIGFVGLIAPHLVRALVGNRPKRVLVPAALAGAAIVTAADIATRLIRVRPEISLGVFISLVGAPFFLWIVLRIRRQTA
jgi:iron complex transport system permease protein